MSRKSPHSKRKKRWLAIAFVVLVLIVNLCFNPWCARWRSLAVMSGYTLSNQRSSLPHDLGIKAEMPLSDTDMYPLMITFNDDRGMSSWLDHPVRFTVDFTFADFDIRRGSSRIFDPNDPLYGAYVGAYYLQGLGRELTSEEITSVAEFDQRYLALPALGLHSADSTFTTSEVSSQATQFNSRNWTNHHASVLTNCPDHQADKSLASYLQFGRPPDTDSHYPLCQMDAQIDVIYFPDSDLTIGLYVLTTSEQQTATLRNEISLSTQIVES